MDLEKRVELLRKRNIELQEENDGLKKEILRYTDEKVRYTELCGKLEKLRKEWENEIAEIKKQREQYKSLINEIKKIKDIFEDSDSNEQSIW